MTLKIDAFWLKEEYIHKSQIKLVSFPELMSSSLFKNKSITDIYGFYNTPFKRIYLKWKRLWCFTHNCPLGHIHTKVTEKTCSLLFFITGIQLIRQREKKWINLIKLFAF